MEVNRLIIAVIYLATGLFFTYIAIQRIDNTVWEITPLILVIVATLSFGVSIRYTWNYFKNKFKK